jgi:hypothetical protein
MDPIIFAQLNEAYQKGVYTQEKTLSEEELIGIEEWVNSLIEEGYDLDQYTDDDLYEAYLTELYKGKHGQTAQQYQAGRSDAGKRISGDDKTGPRHYTLGHSRSSVDSPTSPGSRPLNTPKVTKSELNYARTGHKDRISKNKVNLPEELDLYDLVREYLVSESFCDSYEDADVIMANMSEEWREGILDEVTGGGQIRFRKGLPGRSPKKPEWR